jgi:hypothetical protein
MNRIDGEIQRGLRIFFTIKYEELFRNVARVFVLLATKRLDGFTHILYFRRYILQGGAK